MVGEYTSVLSYLNRKADGNTAEGCASGWLGYSLRLRELAERFDRLPLMNAHLPVSPHYGMRSGGGRDFLVDGP